MKWNQKITLKASKAEGDEKVVMGNKVNKYFAIHPSHTAKHIGLFTVTHIPTGLSVRQTFKNVEIAKKVAKKMFEKFGDRWDFDDSDITEVFSEQDIKSIKAMAGR